MATITATPVEVTVPIVDVDSLLVERGLEVASRRGPAELIEDLGGPTGVIRRLAATFRSIGARRDGQTDVRFGTVADVTYREAEGDLDAHGWTMPMSWDSYAGAWGGSRGWRLTATLTVEVSLDYGDTQYRLSDCRLLAAASVTPAEVQAYADAAEVIQSTKETLFTGVALSSPLERLFSQYLVRRAVRSIPVDVYGWKDASIPGRRAQRCDNLNDPDFGGLIPAASDDEWLRLDGRRSRS